MTPARSAGATKKGRLAELYIEHAAGAIRLAFLLTGDHATAEDLFHEAFVRMARRWMSLRNPDAFGAYLRKTVVNLARSYHRHRQVERAYLAAEAGRSIRTDAPYGGPQDDRLWPVVQSLPSNQRAAIVLRFYEDLSDPEIADVLGCREGTVRSYISRGLSTLRGKAGEPVGDEA